MKYHCKPKHGRCIWERLVFQDTVISITCNMYKTMSYQQCKITLGYINPLQAK